MEDHYNMWTKLLAKIEEELLDKYEVEVSKKGAFGGRGEPSGWRTFQSVRNSQLRNQTEKEEAAAEDEDHDGYDKKDQSERQN